MSPPRERWSSRRRRRPAPPPTSRCSAQGQEARGGGRRRHEQQHAEHKQESRHHQHVCPSASTPIGRSGPTRIHAGRSSAAPFWISIARKFTAGSPATALRQNQGCGTAGSGSSSALPRGRGRHEAGDPLASASGWRWIRPFGSHDRCAPQRVVRSIASRDRSDRRSFLTHCGPRKRRKPTHIAASHPAASSRPVATFATERVTITTIATAKPMTAPRARPVRTTAARFFQSSAPAGQPVCERGGTRLAVNFGARVPAAPPGG